MERRRSFGIPCCLIALLAGALPVNAAPPEHSGWRLTFSDEFDGLRLDSAKWEAESGSPAHILSSRWPENIQVSDGVCRLVTKKENRGGKEWTTAHFWTKAFRQKYGYFEARYRYGAARGLNNAFWLMSRNTYGAAVSGGGDPSTSGRFELDINEGHYPDKVNMTVHNWSGEHWARHEDWTSRDDLSKDFHIFGFEWNERELIWYVDGIIRRVSRNEIAHGEVPVIFSTAVLKWAGEVTDALDGTSLDVDYIRVYERIGPNPAAPKFVSADLYRRPGAYPPAGYVLKWSDDFEGGSLDLSRWRHRTGARLDSISRPENVAVGNGNLVITMKKEPFEGKEYTAGGVINNRKFRYGYYEARAKMFGAPGWHQAFWAIDAERRNQLPGTLIDGIEIDSDDPLQGHTGILWKSNGKSIQRTCSPGVYRRPLGFSTTDYHTYGFEWTENEVRFYFDGALNCALEYPATEHRHDPVNLWLTSVAHEKQSGKVDAARLPGRMHIDHVSFYEKDIYIDDGEPGYREQGPWSDVDAKGFSFSGARESCVAAATAVWQPDVLAAGDYEVFLYRVPGKEGEARVDIQAAGSVKSVPLQFASAQAGWVDLGIHRFEAGQGGRVTLNRTKGCVIADMAKFVRRLPAAGKAD